MLCPKEQFLTGQRVNRDNAAAIRFKRDNRILPQNLHFLRPSKPEFASNRACDCQIHRRIVLTLRTHKKSALGSQILKNALYSLAKERERLRNTSPTLWSISSETAIVVPNCSV